MVSGSTGIIGAVDSLYVLEKDSRTESTAKLHITGRDIEDMQLLLEFDRDSMVWQFISYLSGNEIADALTITLIAFMYRRDEFIGTASELLDALKSHDKDINLSPNSLTRRLKELTSMLEKKHRLIIVFTRKSDARLITITAVPDTHDDDGHLGEGDAAEIPS